MKTQIIGMKDQAREEQATRVKDFMNYQITEVMEEFDTDTDQMLFYLPLSGSTFKKVYYDPLKQRAVAMFVPAEDMVIPYSATDLTTSSRVTHVLRMDENQVRKMQVAGEYKDIELSSSYDDSDGSIKDKVRSSTEQRNHILMIFIQSLRCMLIWTSKDLRTEIRWANQRV